MARFKVLKYIPLTSSVDMEQGIRIEEEIDRMLDNNEPITNTIPSTGIVESDGTEVIPATNIRTDRWEIALEAIDKVQKYETAKSKNAAEIAKKETEMQTVAEAEVGVAVTETKK